MKKTDVIKKIKSLPIITKAENAWIGTKYQPYTLELIELKKVLEVLNVIEKNCKPVGQYSTDNKLIKSYISIVEAASETGINKSSIGKCCSNKQLTAGGYQWKFVNPTISKHIKVLS